MNVLVLSLTHVAHLVSQIVVRGRAAEEHETDLMLRIMQELQKDDD